MLNKEFAAIQGVSISMNTEIKEQFRNLNKAYWLLSQQLWKPQSAFKTGPSRELSASGALILDGVCISSLSRIVLGKEDVVSVTVAVV
jgi:hypothetical protein